MPAFSVFQRAMSLIVSTSATSCTCVSEGISSRECREVERQEMLLISQVWQLDFYPAPAMWSNTVLGKGSTYRDFLGSVHADWLTKWKKICLCFILHLFLCSHANFHDIYRNLSAFRLSPLDQIQLHLTDGYTNCQEKATRQWDRDNN